MRKIRQRILSSLLTGAMLLSMCGSAFAEEPTPGDTPSGGYVDIDEVTQAEIDYTQSAQIPLEGWYNKNLESGRTVKMYVPEYAACRAYFTVVAVPNGVTDVQSWANEQGYVDLMDKRGEVLVVLEPADATAGWKDLTGELTYVTAAMAFANAGKNSSNVALFTNYSTFYLVGYGAGAAPLEAWAAENPILVGSQAYLDGQSVGTEYLTTVGDKTYDGTNTGGYDPGITDVEEFKQVLGGHGYAAKLITRKDVPVPTWFVGYASEDPSLTYWKTANDCEATADGDVYWQVPNSDAFQTEYANSCTAEAHGISQVKVSVSQSVTADELAGFLYQYTRYNVPFAYSNHLSERQDYAEIRVAAQAAAQSAEYLSAEQKVAYDQVVTSDAGTTYDGYYVLTRQQGVVGQGTVESGIIAFSDDNGDGQLDAREYLMYIPDSALGHDAPIVFQFPGNTQSVTVGFDSTQWWRVANDQGVIVVILSEAYNNGGVALTWKNSDMALRAVRDMLEKDTRISIDWTRVYGSGHSLGSNQVQTFVHSHPDFFAAVGSTSFGSGNGTSTYQPVPTMLVTGQSDLPFLMSNLWTSDNLKSWFNYLAEANGLKVTEATQENADVKVEGTARTWTYTWNNTQEIPMVVWGQTYLREHNCYPAEVPMLWDFISNYNLDSNGDRYYSPSAFETVSDKQKIAVPAPQLPTVGDIQGIQAYTDETMYGTGVVEVKVTYKDGVDLHRVTADSYILEDRGSLSPDFGQIKIDGIQVNGQVVTLTISSDTATTADNKLIYTGDSKEGSRIRNAFGIYCTGAWYRDAEGTIHYGSSDEDTYENNTTGMGYQARACLELKLRHTGEEESAAACLADDKGQYKSDGLWAKTVDRQFGEGKFQTFEEAGIQIDSTAVGATDGTQDAYVRGYLYVPENYNPANGIVFTLQGQGISYWKLADGSDNDGTGIMYDSATTSWADKGAIVVNIHDRSSARRQDGFYENYDFVVDDVNVMKYLIDQYHVTGNLVLQGNSRGTMASSIIIKALAGRPYSPKEQAMGYLGAKDKTLDKSVYDFTVDTFICQNGSFGGNGIYDVAGEDYKAVAKTGLKVWCFDGEQDTNNIETVAAYKQAVADTGADVTDDEIRLTGYTSDIYYYWGESDHSTTRMNGWYFDNAAYYGPDLSIVDNQIVYNTKLDDGDTYTLLCRGSAADSSKNGYEYTVYDDLYQVWALEGAARPTPIEETQAAPATIGSYQRINGYFTYQLSVGEESREVEVYIPDGARQREYWISMTLPSGVDSRKFLENAGWFDIADQTKACLLIMKPEEGGWGAAETEMPYVNAAMATLVSSGKYYSAFTYNYVVGYGEGAPVLQLWAAQNPLKMISQVYLNAQADSAYDTLLIAAGNTQVGATPQPNHMDFAGYLDKDGNPLTQKRTFAAQIQKDIPIPTWFVGNTSDSLLTYWKAVNDCAASADPSAQYGQVFWQDKESSDAIATSFSDVKTQVAVKAEGGLDLDSPALTQNIYDFLTYYSGYDNNSVYGHFITQRLDYDKTIASGNMLYRDHMWDGTNRTYIVYIPESVKNTYDLDKPAPVVFANHGAGQTAVVFLEATDIKAAADKYGFIAVTFDLTSNADYMVDLVGLVKQDCKSLGVAVDENRIYAYGQSAGGGAVGNTLAQSPKTVDLFAAFGMTSGVQTATQTNGSNKVVPFYAIYGEYDYWPMKLGQVSAGDWTGSQRTQYQWSANTQTYWANRLLGLTLDELVDESSYTLKDNIGASMVSENTPINLIVNPTATANRYKTYTWSIPADSGEVPIFVWSQCYGRGHNLIPSDLDELWNNWFSKWEKNGQTGTLLYWKDGVGVGSSVTLSNSEPSTESVLRGEAAQKFYEYFNWSHRDEYNDIWAPDMPHFADVKEGDSHWMAIECALQQGVISDGTGNYNPTANLTYADAVDMLANAFCIGKEDVITQLNKVHSGYIPTAAIPATEWNALFTAMTENYVSPVQALPIANTDDIAPRRYVKLWTPTDGATIYFKKTVSTVGYDENITLNINEAPAYNTTDKNLLDATKTTQIYTLNEDGHIKEDYPSNPDTYVTYKVVAVKDGKQSAERIYKWHLQRPTDQDQVHGDYQYTLIQEKTATSPAVYQICRDAESLRPMAWYIEGQTSGVVVDALFTSASTQWNMKEYIDEHMATKPYSLVIGHAHGDHDAQVANFVNAGITTYCNDRGWSSLKSLLTVTGEPETTTNARQALIKNIDEGDSFNLGGCKLDVYALPGHHESLVMLADRANGLVFATDIYGCTRAGSADNVDVSGIPVDLLLSLAQQSHADYERTGVPVKEIFTGHDELPLNHNLLTNFEQALQQVIDKGDYATSYTLRGNNNAMYSRTSLVGDMWKDGTNWMSLKLKGIKGDTSAYLSDSSALYMNTTWSDTAINSSLDYNFVAGVQQYKAYSVLSNVEVVGGQLKGVDLTWKASNSITWGGETTTINYTLHDKFNPWHYDYNISVPSSNSKITIDATTMSTLANITSISLNGVAQDDLTELPVSNGSVVTVVVTAQDGKTTSTYHFTVNWSDLDDITDLQKDFSQAAQLPLTGYYTKNIDVNGNGSMDDNRTVKVYIAPEASIRSYFTVVAVPDGVDTYQFLSEQSWLTLADQKGEGLFILEPGTGGWGTAAEEAAYLDAATAFLKSGNNVNAQNVFSTFGEFYLVGYGKGAAALERWAAQNPIFVIGQAYVDGTSVGSESLASVAGTTYDGKSANGDITDVLAETLQKVGIDGQITPKDVPVPTWLVSYTGSESYWKAANDCVSEADDGVYHQNIDSNAYQTNYSNQQLKAAGATYGISQVKVSGSAATAAEIYDWMSEYTRYDTTFAYSNAIASRLDYTAARVAAQQEAKDGKTNKVLSNGTQILAQNNMEIDGHGTVQVGVIAFSDNNGDGTVDPREYILYIPEGFEGKELPVLMVYPGNTQTDSIFLDSTLWWQIAEEKGIALAFICETYNASPSSVSHADSDKFYTSLMTLLKETVDGKLATLDFTRVYGSGQSAGSAATQGFAVTNPEFFAAVGSTSATPKIQNNSANKVIPSIMVTGQMDAGNMAGGFASTDLQSWAGYMLKVNGLNATFAADKATSVTNVDSRHPEVYTWSKSVSSTEVPLVRWAQCLLRPHNCYPSDITMLWDFLEHYSFETDSDGTITRYYSPTAFVQNDAVKIDPIESTHTGGGSGSSSGSKQSVGVKTPQNGSITTNIASSVKGSEVTITVKPKTGYELTSLKVTTSAGVELALTDKGNGRYSFTMPGTAVTVTGVFAAAETKLPYTDAAKGDWYYDAVVFAHENGLMSGMGNNTFAPNHELSRAMIAQILYRLENTPATAGTSFTDVQDEQWYADAVTWAVQSKIVSGYGAGKFGPDDSITREQLAAILYSYEQYKKPGTTASGSLDAFRDGSSASDWAVESLVWAVDQGLMSGKTGNMLDPNGTATRAEVAQILMKFLQIK